MKSIYLFIVIVFTWCLTSCMGADNDLPEGSSLYESMKTTYGIEEIPSGLGNPEQVPSVSIDEMQAILVALRSKSNQKNNCLIVQANDADFGDSNEVNKRIIMGSEYTAKTQSGSSLDFLLQVELKFNTYDNKVFYYGTDYLFDAHLFDWRVNRLSIAPAKNGYTYEFESQSYLFFKLRDKVNCLVRVSIGFKGEFNFNTETGTYGFRL